VPWELTQQGEKKGEEEEMKESTWEMVREGGPLSPFRESNISGTN